MSSSELSEWESENDVPTLERPIFKSKEAEAEWERKQRNREYRVAARREKRTRKADEKKQRKLNATILRRMTKNPDKYNKNVDRNRRRDIELERRKIWREAVSQAERLAAIHDPSGQMFNVGPVVVQEDGKVVSVEFLERKAQAQAERALKLAQGNGVSLNGITSSANGKPNHSHVQEQLTDRTQDGINPARRQLIESTGGGEAQTKKKSKNQQKKLAMLEPRPLPPKPFIPSGIALPEGEENWLALWDLSDDELERRVIRERKRKAAERKALREKQKAGKAERRAARDERRRVYREKKLEWKAIKEAEKIQKRKLLRVEQEEAKKIETEVNLAERKRAMEVCAELGFTLSNVEGVQDIKPKALGMKGKEVDFDILEIGARPSELKVKDERIAKQIRENATKSNRVDLGRIADESKTNVLTSDGAAPASMEGDFVSLDFGNGLADGQEFEALNYNHKLRRKLHRAIEAAQIQKELLVRAKAKEHCEENGIPVPPELVVEYKPIKLSGRRILEDGSIETEKQERVRKRLELAEYNKAAKVLRQQAKAEAIEAGLRLFAQLTGKKASDSQDIPVEASLNGITNATEQESKPMDPVSKKRQRYDDETDIRMVKKSRHSSISSNTSSLAEPVGSGLKIKKPKKTKRPDTNTAELAGTKAETVNESNKAKAKTKKRKVTGGLEEQHALNSNEDDVACKKQRRPKKTDQEPNNLSGDSSEDNFDPESASTLKSKTKKAKHTKDEAFVVAPHPEKDEKSKKHRSNKVKATEAGIETYAKSGEQWNVDALKGDATRKDKFLRLLGAGKSNSVEKPAKKDKAKVVDLVRVEDELEKQFEAGIRMKHDGQAKRRGLGA